jgi:glycine betaine/proline transport system substrate-binding protein
VVIQKTDLFGKTYRGTGFFIVPNLIATNQHVVKEASKISIQDAAGRSLTVLGIRAMDPLADTALIEVMQRSPHVLTLDPVRRVEVGDPVYVIGNPMGYSRSLSQGLVSGIRTRTDSIMYQISATVAHGSSGSPVIDAGGHVIGIVFGRLPQEATIAFAAPSANLAGLSDGSWRPPRPIALGDGTNADFLTPDIQLNSLPEDTPHGKVPTAQSGATPGKKTANRAKRPFVRIGVPNWDSGVAMANLLAIVIRNRLGIDARLVPSTNDMIFAGIDRNDRSFDIHPDVWLPNHSRFLDAHVHLSPTLYQATQGICVPRYVLSRYSVRHRSDLSNPLVARLFDSDNDGRGELWIGPRNWQSSKIESLKARDYRYSSYLDLIYADERDVYQKLDAAVATRKPFAFYCYGPHWVMRKHDLVVLREKPYSRACFHLANSGNGADWFDASQAACEGPPSTIHRAYSDYVANQLPEVAKLLDHLNIGYESMNDLLFKMAGGGNHNNATIARAWARANRKIIDRHLPPTITTSR